MSVHRGSVFLLIFGCILILGVHGEIVVTPYGKVDERCVRRHGAPLKHDDTFSCTDSRIELNAKGASPRRGDAAAAPHYAPTYASSSSASSGSGVADGTQAYTIATQQQYSIVSASTEFNVPQRPTSSSGQATVMLVFNIADNDWVPPAPLPYPDMLSLECTLQWGKTAAGTVEGEWAIVVWAKDFYGDITHSELIAVQPNDIITASMQLVGTGSWHLNMTAEGPQGTQSVSLSAFSKADPAPANLMYAMLRYDAYFTNLCSELPPVGSNVVFSAIDIQTSHGPWSSAGMWNNGELWDVPLCAAGVQVFSAAEVRLFMNLCTSTPPVPEGCTTN